MLTGVRRCFPLGFASKFNGLVFFINVTLISDFTMMKNMICDEVSKCICLCIIRVFISISHANVTNSQGRNSSV